MKAGLLPVFSLTNNTTHTTVMWGMIVATIATFYPVIKGWALGLLLPYLAWVSFATCLTIWIWRNNPRRGVSGGRCTPEALAPLRMS